MDVSLILVLLAYFGALVVPVSYLAMTRFRGPARRAMLIGIGLQLVCSGGVWGFVYFSWRAGYTDSWMGWGLLLPVNIVGFIYFTAVLATYVCRSKAQRQRA